MQGQETKGISGFECVTVEHAFVQGKSAAQTKDDSENIHKIAAKGVQGTGGKLPHLNQIQKSFGRFNVSQVQAYTGRQSRESASAMGAQAYASGNKVAFRSANPNLATAAHEAAHVVQQRRGVHLKYGVGKVGDVYEQHADSVADLVVRGHSAEPLLARAPNQPVSPQGDRAVQKTPIQFLTGTPVYIPKSQTAQLAGIPDKGSGIYPNKVFHYNQANQVTDNMVSSTLSLPDVPGYATKPGHQAARQRDLKEYILQIDHIVPKSKGGGNTNKNGQILNAKENRDKSSNYPPDDISGASGVKIFVPKHNLVLDTNAPKQAVSLPNGLKLPTPVKLKLWQADDYGLNYWRNVPAHTNYPYKFKLTVEQTIKLGDTWQITKDMLPSGLPKNLMISAEQAEALGFEKKSGKLIANTFIPVDQTITFTANQVKFIIDNNLSAKGELSFYPRSVDSSTAPNVDLTITKEQIKKFDPDSTVTLAQNTQLNKNLWVDRDIAFNLGLAPEMKYPILG